jgi:hypothetical protein
MIVYTRIIGISDLKLDILLHQLNQSLYLDT